MRISQVAEILGMAPKDVIQEIENLRESFTTQGFKLAKRLTASSGVDDDAVRLLMAEIDTRRQEKLREEEESRKAQAREEDEKRRAEEAAKRAREEEERRKVQEEERRKADEKLAKRREEMARLASLPTPEPPKPVETAKVETAPQLPPPTAPSPKAMDVTPPAPPVQKAQPPAAPPAAPRPAAPPNQQQPRNSAPSKPQQQQQRPAAPGGGKPKRGREDKRNKAASAEELANFSLEPTLKDERPTRRRDDRGKSKSPNRTATDSDAPVRPKRTRTPTDLRRGIGPTQIFQREVVTRRPPKSFSNTGPRKRNQNDRQRDRRQAPQLPKRVRLIGDFTVGQFADKLSVDASEVMKRLLLMGEFLTINHLLNPDLAELIADEMGIEIVIERESDDADISQYVDIEDSEDSLQPRPPVVTIMGHVDHGKTTLLDRIRSTNVVDSEHGGITQHIGAYYVTTNKGDIAFLDTPGHEAFTAMRARGANVTDVVILVVAANDGVKPQTVEAINHAKAAEVPIIVAINKIDVEGANVLRVKQELMRYELVSEDLGGETIMVEVSAKKGTNIQDLLEMVALQAEVLELHANPDRAAIGTIVESHMDPTRGAVATVLVEAGTLEMGDVFVVGTQYGRIRAMRDDKGAPMEKAGPAQPVEIMGLTGSPAAGERLVVVPTEAEAREIAEKRDNRRKVRSAKAKPHITLDSIKDHLHDDEVKTLNLIVKGDVQGSVEAICASLLKIKSDKIVLNILHNGVGTVSEGDVMLADASDAIIIGFNVRPDPATRELAERVGVQIRLYNIIYDLIGEIESAMVGMLEPEYEEVPMSRTKIQQIFRVSKVGNIAGCLVEEGTIGKDHSVRLVRDGIVVWSGKLKTLRRVKDDAKEVQSGVECGIGLENFNDIKEGDVIESFVLKQKEASLVHAGPSGESND